VQEKNIMRSSTILHKTTDYNISRYFWNYTVVQCDKQLYVCIAWHTTRFALIHALRDEARNECRCAHFYILFMIVGQLPQSNCSSVHFSLRRLCNRIMHITIWRLNFLLVCCQLPNMHSWSCLVYWISFLHQIRYFVVWTPQFTLCSTWLFLLLFLKYHICGFIYRILWKMPCDISVKSRLPNDALLLHSYRYKFCGKSLARVQMDGQLSECL
jgi:hypothetical protein